MAETAARRRSTAKDKPAKKSDGQQVYEAYREGRLTTEQTVSALVALAAGETPDYIAEENENG